MPVRPQVRILGVDPGSHVTGYGVIDSGSDGLRCLEAGALRGGKGEAAARLGSISRQLAEVIVRQQPAIVAVERVFVARNVASALMLGQARGAVLACVGAAGLDVVEYSATQIKQAVVGSGRAGKEQVRHMAGVLLQMTLDDTALDTSDALACAICHAHGSGVQGLLAVASGSRRRRSRGRGLRL